MTLDEFQSALGYRFRNRDLLEEALTHRTFAMEQGAREGGRPVADNERLEFLGDSLLSLAMCHRLFLEPERLSEGRMTRIRALVVCEPILAEAAMTLGVDGLLRVGKGEAMQDGQRKPSTLANAMEAVFAAVYLDSEWESARDTILRILERPYLEALAGRVVHDYKSLLLERIQALPDPPDLRFEILSVEGPAHEPRFTAGIRFGSRLAGQGTGTSKQKAEQDAARSILESWPEDRTVGAP